MWTWIVVVSMIASSACSKTECPVAAPPPPIAASKPTADQVLVGSRKDAREAVEDVIRRVATLGWRFELRGHLGEVLVVSSMTNLLADKVADMCTRKALPSFVDGKFTPPSALAKWKADLARFTRVECIDAGGIVVAMNVDKAGKWSVDTSSMDLTALEHTAGNAPRPRTQQEERYEVEDEDPDRFVFGPVNGFHDAVKSRAAATKQPATSTEPAKPAGDVANPF